MFRLNCNELVSIQYIPTLPMVLTEMGQLGTFLIAISGIVTIIIGLIFIEGSVRLYRNWPLKSYCIAVATIAVFPIVIPNKTMPSLTKLNGWYRVAVVVFTSWALGIIYDFYILFATINGPSDAITGDDMSS
ncbi:unnamed protein product [Medioppia subpectinata]|uniref:Uncharacterized protein n=1 Tax=Medioppia subpectinata TaxID=1979941 RepID=A0A7R9KDT3_9ACAR|nr:unnamed protein product [Medioppia subpectinata]CAG2101460.1 unnamed protein product [Medioppia subpectinata]